MKNFTFNVLSRNNAIYYAILFFVHLGFQDQKIFSNGFYNYYYEDQLDSHFFTIPVIGGKVLRPFWYPFQFQH